MYSESFFIIIKYYSKTVDIVIKWYYNIDVARI
jgi:hypothetical protein